ncbi:hypothetical protein HanRHA438_Chr17g0835431 [Helianthus annuus]|nr:hypothetical protein HanRHA438_Chr17g0835431 [Helianthus annuus]
MHTCFTNHVIGPNSKAYMLSCYLTNLFISLQVYSCDHMELHITRIYTITMADH